MEFQTGRAVKTTERRHMFTNFPGGDPPDPQYIHPSPLRGSTLLCPADGGLRPLLSLDPLLL